MTDITHPIKLTTEEQAFKEHVRAVYNNGQMQEAYELAKEYYLGHKDSLLAKYLYAGMAGDYADAPLLQEEKKTEMRETAKRLIKEVYDHEDLERTEFSSAAKNEFYWFHQLHEEQYHFGKKRVAAGEVRGYYSMCVGASAMAKRCLLELKDKPRAATWAEKSAEAFRQFEKIDPHWHNINYFYAYSLAILGKMAEAEAAYRDMYRKQNNPVNEGEFENFRRETNNILTRLREKQ